jgi:hypothetical protein
VDAEEPAQAAAGERIAASRFRSYNDEIAISASRLF